MRTIKQELKILLAKPPDNCTLEDVQYHLHRAERPPTQSELLFAVLTTVPDKYPAVQEAA